MRRKADCSTSFFTQALSAQLLLGADAPGDTGHVVAVLPAALSGTGNTFTIADALGSAQLNASIVFLRHDVGTTLAEQQQFVAAFLKLVGTRRVMMWLPDPAVVPATLSGAAVPYVVLQGTGTAVTTTSPLAMTVGPTLGLVIAPQQPVAAGASSVAIGSAQPQPNWLLFNGPSALSSAYLFLQPLNVPFTGPNRGCLQFSLYTPQSTLNWGFLFGVPGAANAARPQSLFAPLALGDQSTIPGFAATFDPLDPQAASHRHVLVFLGVNRAGNKTVLRSYYTAPDGSTSITLTPIVAPQTGDVAARLVFSYPPTSIAIPSYLTLQPDGDFILGLSGSTATSAQLLCGLQGAEYLEFHPATATYAGDRLRYVSRSKAFVPTFPFPISSPVAPPFDPSAPTLTGTWTTSWATIRPPSTAPQQVAVVAQPPGFNLFGHDDAIHAAHPNLLGHADPGTLLPLDPKQPFPLVPYLGVAPNTAGTTFSAQQVSDFESQVLGPARHAAIVLQEKQTTRVLSARRKLARRTLAGDTTQVNVATPSGYLVTLNEDASTNTATWAKILLAKLMGPPQQELAFVNPDPKLEQAFQAGQLMLVVANAQHTGDFENALTIGGWQMAAAVDQPNSYADYANVIVVKAVPGALYDPNAPDPTANLVANPSKWTMASDFGAPSTPSGGTDASQLPSLSLWLQQYFAAAFAANASDPAYFGAFCSLASNPAWTGVLVLRGKIVAPPPGIAGITAGVTAPELFNVHHLAIPLTPIANLPSGPDVTQSSAVSGLIYYLDPAADPKNPSTPIPADPTQEYAFRLLSLKVLFENSALRAFSSYVQVTLRKLFQSGAQSAQKPDADAIVLTGSYQLVDKQPVYSMASTSDSPFLLANDVLRRVEITGVQMSTVKADPAGDTVSAFSMTGFLDFAVVPGINYGAYDPKNPRPIDFFGYGNAAGQTLPRQGLAFQALTLTMTFPTQSPSTAPGFVLSTDPMRFDLTTTTVREASLVREFNLQLTGYIVGSGSPAQMGYLPVVAMIPAGTLGASWNGLVFRIDLGTPGHLASAAGLNSSLLLAWSPAPAPAGATTFAVQIGLELPGTAQGAPLISLQNVLKLSIGQVALAYTSTADKARYGFLLLLNEIAMSFLGLLKIPPNGATSFYLFGDPNGANALGWYAVYNNEPKT